MNKLEPLTRIDRLLEMIERIGSLEHTKELEMSDNHDKIDAIALGLNMLNEELRSKMSEISVLDKKYFNLYNNSPDMMLSIKPQSGTIIECNQTLANKTGYLKEELIGKTIYFLYHPDCFKRLEKAFQLFIETGSVVNAELELKKKDGTKLFVLLNVEAIRDQNGTILYSNSTCVDVTELKIFNSIIFQQEKDREKIANDLHDGLAQTLTGMAYQLSAIAPKFAKYADFELKRSLLSIQEYNVQCLKTTKQLANEMMPRTMMTFGLASSLKGYINQEKNNPELQIQYEENTSEIQFDKEIEISVFRAVTEIIEKAKTSFLTKNIIIHLNSNELGLHVMIEIPTEPNSTLDNNFNFDDIVLSSFQKRIEIQGGKMTMNKCKKGDCVTINIKFENLN